MSLLGKLAKPIRQIGKMALSRTPIGAAAVTAYGALKAAKAPSQPQYLPGGMGGMMLGLSTLPALPGVGRAVAGGATALVKAARSPTVRKWSKRAIDAAGAILIGEAVYDAAGNYLGQRSRRRINPMNHRALNRAIRRVCAAKKISKKIEKLTGSGRRSSIKCSPKSKRC